MAHDRGVAPLVCDTSGENVRCKTVTLCAFSPFVGYHVHTMKIVGNSFTVYRLVQHQHPCFSRVEKRRRSYTLTFVELTSTFMFSSTRIVSGSFLEAATCRAETPDPWVATTTNKGRKA